jgi:hypothetical protein
MQGNIGIYPVWLFLAAVFFYYAYVNWRQSQTSLREFQFRVKEGAEKPSEIDPSIKEFVGDFNRYLQSVNSNNKTRHRAAAFGYLVAGIVALVSMFLMLS